MLAVAVDLGKSRCRLLVNGGADPIRLDAAGAPGLAAADGVEAALVAILPLLARVAEPIESLGVGAAGAWSAPAAAARLAGALAERTRARVVVASDVVAAHAGAFAGAPGVLLIAGTGAAALGVDDAGVRLVDGWGPELGDLGGGSWLGREGIRAVLRAEAGLGAATVLAASLRAHIAPAADVHAWLATGGPVARRLATFAPAVLDAAAGSDPVAAGIAAEAVRLLTASAVAASRAAAGVVVHGGLTDHPWFRASLAAKLAVRGRTVAAAVGDALEGALLLAARTDLPHERHLHRAG